MSTGTLLTLFHHQMQLHLHLLTYKTIIVTHHFIQTWLIMQYNFRCSSVNIYKKLLHISRFIIACMMSLSSTSLSGKTRLTTSVFCGLNVIFRKYSFYTLDSLRSAVVRWNNVSSSFLTHVLWQRHGNRSSAGCSANPMSVRTLGSVTWSLAYSYKMNIKVTEKIMTGRGSTSRKQASNFMHTWIDLTWGHLW